MIVKDLIAYLSTLDPAAEAGGAIADLFQHAVSVVNGLYGAPIGTGGSRNVYATGSDGCVLKVPRHFRGCRANEQEAASWDKDGNPVGWILDGEPLPRARCHLDEPLSKRLSVPILRMERVSCARGQKDLPAWAKNVDSKQVGYTRDGRLVAYDWENA